MEIDPALLRGLTEHRYSRRDVMRGAGLGAGLVGMDVLLAACGVKAKNAQPSGTSSAAATSSSASGAGSSAAGSSAGESASASASASTSVSASESASATAPAMSAFWQEQKLAHQLNFANWPLYIDQQTVNGKTVRPSIEAFTKETGIKVTYKEVIQDTGDFFGIQQPVFAAHKDIGYDLMVMTNGIYMTKLISLGYLTELEPSLMPNFHANADKSVQNPSYDPGNKYTMAWQSGLTGIAYDPKKTKREITSFADLFDPAFKGKVGMFADNLDLPNFSLAGLGINPETSTPDDWRKAAAKLMQQRSAGLVRKYYTQDYVDPLLKGDIWISMAFSGDIFQANAGSDQLKFVVPQEGGVIWTDNMCIPAKAKHPLDAITYMDYVYQPEVAAVMAESINYITPVDGARDGIKAHAAKAAKPADKTALEALADSPLIFPSADDLARVHHYRSLTPAEEKEWNKIFQPIYQS
ncbi:MAG: spermidine/putrescine ABC transporter substrate-binding protein [Actinomycetota bacterium]